MTFGVLGLICLFYFVKTVLLLLSGHTLPDYEAFWGLLCGLSGVGSYQAAKMGAGCIDYSRNIDPGVPLTRANTADLPVSDSLVRGSSEPIHEQQAVLLRAAAVGQEKHEEQLVRPAAGGQE